MSRWTDPTIAIAPYKRADTGAWEWAVSDDLRWDLVFEGSPLSVTVPMGFSTDLGSIPAWLRWLFSGHDPQCVKAYILHDYLLLIRHERGWSQQFCAGQMFDAMKADDVAPWSRRLQYHGVSLAIDEW